MTRRERHIRIIESWGDSSFVRSHVQRMQSHLGVDCYTDAAIEFLARDLCESRARQVRYAKEHHARNLLGAA